MQVEASPSSHYGIDEDIMAYSPFAEPVHADPELLPVRTPTPTPEPAVHVSRATLSDSCGVRYIYLDPWLLTINYITLPWQPLLKSRLSCE